MDVGNDLIVRDEYLGWVDQKNEIDYYGVTFDHLVPTDDYFPEVLQINICEIDVDQGESGGLYWEEDIGGTKVLSKEERKYRPIES
ncbi:uncharacterized protein PG998_014330 [Apiospora kogelbergensis]|uniref:uncharacterized protein n=1 Tax=Apiospora kogelbergensis TaxID=1337665 RepID=UPI00312CC7BB